MSSKYLPAVLSLILVCLSVGVAADISDMDTSPPALYCRGMGYKYTIKDIDSMGNGVCRLPDGSNVSAWDFLTGASPYYSYCRRMGYPYKVESGTKCPGDYAQSSRNCLMCVLPGGKQVEVLEFMGLREASPENPVSGIFTYLFYGVLLVIGALLLVFLISRLRGLTMNREDKYFLEEKIDMLSLKIEDAMNRLSADAGGRGRVQVVTGGDVEGLKRIADEMEEERKKVADERQTLEGEMKMMDKQLKELAALKESREKELLLLEEERLKITDERRALENQGMLIRKDITSIEGRFDHIKGTEKKVEGYKDIVEKDTRIVEKDTRVVEADARLVEKDLNAVDVDRKTVEEQLRRIEADRKAIEARSEEIEFQKAAIQKEEQKIASERRKVSEEKAEVARMMKEIKDAIAENKRPWNG